MGAQLIKPVPRCIPRMPIYYETFSARNFNTSALTIDSLLSDTYDYTVIIQIDDASGDSNLDVTCNTDTSTNYRNYEMKGLSTTASAAVGDSDSAIELQNIIGTANNNLLIMKITGGSSDERYFDISYSADGAILKQSSYWKNTADEITQIVLTAATSVTCDATIAVFAQPKDLSENWVLVESGSVSQDTSSTPFDISNLDGDVHKQYLLRVNNAYVNSSADQWLQLNGDSTFIYDGQELRNASGSLTAATRSGFNRVLLMDAEGSGRKANQALLIHAETGQKRLVQLIGGQINGAGSFFNQRSNYWWYNNTATNLTSLRFTLASSDTANFDYELWRPKNPDTVADRFNLPFKMLKETAVSGDFSAGDTLSFDCDKALMIKIEGLFSTVGNDLRLQLDGDTSSNYDEQYLKGVSSSASAASATAAYKLLCDASSSKVAHFEYYLFPQSGENRPSLLIVGHGEDSIELKAHWWNNTVDEINSIKVYASSTTTCTGTLKYSYLPLPKNSTNAITSFINDRNDKFTVSDSASLDITGDFTLAAWGKPDSGSSTQDSGIIGKQGAYVMWQHTGSLKLDLNGTTHVGPSVTETEWNFYMCRRDGSSVDMSINDGTKTNHTFGTTLTTNSTDVLLGNYSVGTRGFEGSLAGFGIWNIDLTDAQVTQLYNGGVMLSWAEIERLGLDTGCVMYIEAAEHTDLVGNAYDDQSGNSNDATETSIDYSDAGLRIF